MSTLNYTLAFVKMHKNAKNSRNDLSKMYFFKVCRNCITECPCTECPFTECQI